MGRLTYNIAHKHKPYCRDFKRVITGTACLAIIMLKVTGKGSYMLILLVFYVLRVMAMVMVKCM